MKRFAFWLLAASMPLFFHASPALSAVDLFLQVDGIKGESKEQNHKDWIDVLSFSWGASNSGSFGSGGGGGAGKVSFSDFSFMKFVDISSPPLAQATFSGTHIKQAILEVVNSASHEAFLKYTMTDILVSSFQQSGSSEIPTESISFNFAKFAMDYRRQDDKGGFGPWTHAGWDIKMAKPAPEPSTWALLIGGLALLAWRGTRRARARGED